MPSFATVPLACLLLGSAGATANAFVPPPTPRRPHPPRSVRCFEPRSVPSIPIARRLAAIEFEDFGSEGANDRGPDDRRHREVHLFESVLRDGEQGARRLLTPDQKGLFARRLEDALGGDVVIDAGLPGASPLDFAGVRSVVRRTRRTTTLSVLAHGSSAEIATAARSLAGAEDRSRIATFHRPAELSSARRRGGRRSAAGARNKLLKRARRAVGRASDLAPEVQYYLVYAGNRDPSFLAELARTASDAGASQVIVADSQSAILAPSRMRKLVLAIKEAMGDGRAEAGVHCHDQLGLALPNTLAAIAAGATQVESCLGGIGDAGGNLATEQFLAYCAQSRAAAATTAGRWQDADDDDDDEVFPSSCAALGCDLALPAAVALANEVARTMEFTVGENQPIIGERAFTCTTGIHQDNLSRLAHTAFPPRVAGREWKIELNRHSSRKSVRSFVLNRPELIANGSAKSKEVLMDALYSYLSYRVDAMDEGAAVGFCRQLLDAHAALRHRGGVAICPTTVGYTLVTARNAAKMKSIKGRPDGKPCGVLGTPGIYRAVFGSDPPLERDPFVARTVGYLGHPRGLAGGEGPARRRLPDDAVGRDGEVGVWLELGPVVDYLATRLWSESGDVLVATSCNAAGEGNPRSEAYGLSHVDPRVRSAVDFEITIPHWERPEVDDDGRWLSAPIWDLERKAFVREGRNQGAIASLLLEKEAEELEGMGLHALERKRIEFSRVPKAGKPSSKINDPR